MTINGFRSWLYLIAKLSGDVQAVSKSARKGSIEPIVKRVGRRIAGKAVGRSLWTLFR